MYYFKQESTLIKQLLLFCRTNRSVVSRYSKLNIALIGFSSLCLTACNQASVQRKIGHNLIKTPVIVGEKTALTPNHPAKPVNLSGLWKIGFKDQGKKYLGNMQIQQSNQSFSGQGQDEISGAAFKIEQGQIKGDEIIFLKRYDKRPDQAVQYHGHFSYLPSESGEVPYMGGDFSVEMNGALTVGEWEAAMPEIKSPVLSTKEKDNDKTGEEEPKQAINQEEHYPDLSGKWSVAYEYNFKTVHSIMFLEQDGNKLSGHGADSNTKEKFIIKKGWYDFPHLTIVRQYPARSAGNNLMTFKAEVSEVSDKDYVGPYLSGKTQGGGDWEAERVN